MPFYEKLVAAKDKAIRAFSSLVDDGEAITIIPKEKDALVGNYTTALWEDGKKYYEHQFSASKACRLWDSSPEDFIKNCLSLEAGNDFDVWGHRDTDKGQQELVDGEISDQVRTRSSYLTANWHDVTIMPNINGINDIFDQERKSTDWGRSVRRWTKYMQFFGDVWVRSVLDKTENPEGSATEFTCRPLSVYKTPYATSIKKRDGCWYIAIGEQVSGQWVKSNYPSLKLSELSDRTSGYPELSKLAYTDKSYNHTKMYNKLEIYLDDESLEEIPLSQDEFYSRIGEVLSGATVSPKQEDNHKKFMQKYAEFLDERIQLYTKLNEEGQLSEIDIPYINSMSNAVEGQISAHQEMANQIKEKNPDIPIGKRKKYPFGRYIVTINGEVAEDIPNPYLFDWRLLWHYIPNEEIPERMDGRGDVEILTPTQKINDIMLSHFADGESLGGTAKPWLHITDKDQIEKNGYTNDPWEISYYTKNPPEFPSARANDKALELYNISKENSKRKLGISGVTYGDAPTKSASGELADTLLSQNETVVTGEANQNISDAIEEIVETRILIWRKFYNNPRVYNIGGVQTELVLVEHLNFTQTDVGGQMTAKPIGDIQVSVRPESNFPNKWENTIRLLSQLSAIKNEDGVPLIPSEMILDLLGQRFPDLAAGGKYHQTSKIIQLGMQVMQEQQARQQEEEKDTKLTTQTVEQKMRQRLATDAVNKVMGEPNGEAK
jgi:hypothetical protein